MFPLQKKTITFFICIFLILASLFLVSIPVFAGTSVENPEIILSSVSPTVSVSLRMTASPTQPVVGADASQRNTVIMTGTQTITPTLSATPTSTPSLTPTPTNSPTPLSTQFAYIPYLYRDHFVPTSTPLPTPSTVLFCDSISSPIAIPDNNNDGMNNDIFIGDPRALVGLRLYLDISHTYIGDLVVTLTNLTNGNVVTVLNRPGNQPYGCSNSDIVTIMDDGAIQKADDQCASYPQAISGIYIPTQPLEVFRGLNTSGTWRLNVSDHYINDIGSLNHWCLETRLSDFMPPPTPTPTPVYLPSEAYIYGMTGQNQQMKLDCESRSAVDWAYHFGFSIGELEFLYRLPFSDDPETGFVGNPAGNWGNIPPNDYGVHAPPISSLLNSYGLMASPFKSLTWDDLRSEIANGNPVIVWIIGDDYRNIVNGTPHYYTASSTGNTTVVAPFEHTVILVGYSPSTATVLNGAKIMDVPLDQFLDSWSVLDFMAVLAR
jgi:subtilisin-like proprotein convertase family protein/uncharacterized protein YvpB